MHASTRDPTPSRHRPLHRRAWRGVAWHEFALTCTGNISERVNEEPQSARGRSKYSSYQSNFKAGRKSSSLMNLCGKSLSKHSIKLDSRW